MKSITPFLWFNNNAEEAVNFYISVFRNSGIKKVLKYGEAGAGVSGMPAGSVMTILFEINGEEFTAINGGPVFTFSPAISFVVNCDTQDEIDYYWDRLSDGGVVEQCGWLRDRFGVSWQIVPRILDELIGDPDHDKSESVFRAMLGMVKIDIDVLVNAYNEV